MMVNCVANDLAKIELDAVRSRLGRSIHRDDPNRDIRVGHEYQVLAVECWDRGIWFFIHSVPQNDYPLPYPAEYFDIIDAAVASDWQIKFSHDGDGLVLKRISFSEWANDDTFYERLVEGDVDAIKVFRQRVTES